MVPPQHSTLSPDEGGGGGIAGGNDHHGGAADTADPADGQNHTDQKKPPPLLRVAVIGGGVSGLAAAWHLHHNGYRDRHGNRSDVRVVLLEASDRLGGHAWTVRVPTTPTPTTPPTTAPPTAPPTTTPPVTKDEDDGTEEEGESHAGGGGTLLPVDIGFMVYNEANYPNLVEWFRALGVDSEESDMSLAVSLQAGNTAAAAAAGPHNDDTAAFEWSSDGFAWPFDMSSSSAASSLGGGAAISRKNSSWSQLLSWNFCTFLTDLLYFHHTAADLLRLTPDDPRRHVTVRQYLRDHRYSTAFATHYLLPLMAALWSASVANVLDFPAVQLVSFLQNHQMLQLAHRPTWRTVSHRSVSYVRAVATALVGADGDRGRVVQCNTRVRSVRRRPDGSYQLYTADGTVVRHDGNDDDDGACCFDHVVFACHPPTAAAILERGALDHSHADLGADDLVVADWLRAVQYADNVVYVHSDPALMPKSAWASWNCLGDRAALAAAVKSPKPPPPQSFFSRRGEAFEGAESGFGAQKNVAIADDHCLEGLDGRFKAVYVTYWLNRLQNLPSAAPDVFVSLNPHRAPDPSLTHQRVVLAHPQFTPRTLYARQQLLQHHQGAHGLWFCGAWSGYGFHEDGCRSGFAVATALSGVPLPWATAQTPVLPPPDFAFAAPPSMLSRFYQTLTYDIPVAVCKRFIYYFLNQAVQNGTLRLKFNDGSTKSFGDGTPCGCDSSAVTLRIFDPWFFVKVALGYDLGLARSYMAGHFVVEALDEPSTYHPVIRPADARDETTVVLGDPIGLTRLFLLLIGNRDRPLPRRTPKKSRRGHSYAGAMTNASGLLIGRIGSLVNYIRYKVTMNNSEGGGSLRNIHAHYDLSNDLFTTFLDKETIMYSSAIFEAVQAPGPQAGLVFRGTLEDAQWRKLDTLLDRAQVQPGQTLLDIGFGWGGLSIHAAKKYGCRVTGITLSVEQKVLAEKRVKEEGLLSLVTFEVVDYRTFARRKENQGKFDRVLSCEMIEAVGHRHLGEFFWAVEQVLAQDGILVMEAITTPEERYETYIRSTDFINTVIFPGSCCPSLHALVDAAYQQSSLTLEHIDNIGLHYAQTLAEWRRRFNASEDAVRSLGFDDVFLRAWNYYLTYCEAGFFSQTENCLILVFSRQGCASLLPLSETRSVTQHAPLSLTETSNWLTDGVV